MNQQYGLAAPDLTGVETYGWKPNDALSEDENYLDLVHLVTRSAKLNQGSMACILVRPSKSQDESLTDRIVSVANNQELYRVRCSDIHAEVAAIGTAARLGRSTENCTAYITMPPCKNCFGSLVMAGIRKVYTSHVSKGYDEVKRKRKIEMSQVDDLSVLRARVQGIVEKYQTERGIKKQKSEDGRSSSSAAMEGSSNSKST